MSAITPPADVKKREVTPAAAEPERAELAEMSALHRYTNLAGVVLPMVGLAIAIVVGWGSWVDWSAMAALAVMYVLTGFGVTFGFHCLLMYRSF